MPVIKQLSITHDILILALGAANLNSINENRQVDVIKEEMHSLNKDHAYTVWSNRVTNERGVSIWYESDIENVLTSLVNELDRVSTFNVDCVIYDDSRTAGHQVPKIIFEPFYEEMKKRNIPVIANIHGNVDNERLWKFVALEQGKIYDKLCIYGEYDRNRLKAYDIDNHIMTTGIPSNDLIRAEVKTDSHILIVLNRVDFDGMTTDMTIVENLQINDLWQRYRLPVVFKVKPPPRIIDSSEKNKEEAALVHLLQSMVTKNRASLDPNMPLVITADEYAENWLISNSKCIISYGSTMCLKALQVDKPTVIIREMGNVANFENYHGTISVHEDFFNVLDKWEDKKEERDKFLKETLEGAAEFNSTGLYLESVYGVIDEWKQKNTNQ